MALSGKVKKPFRNSSRLAIEDFHNVFDFTNFCHSIGLNTDDDNVRLAFRLFKLEEIHLDAEILDILGYQLRSELAVATKFTRIVDEGGDLRFRFKRSEFRTILENLDTVDSQRLLDKFRLLRYVVRLFKESNGIEMDNVELSLFDSLVNDQGVYLPADLLFGIFTTKEPGVYYMMNRSKGCWRVGVHRAKSRGYQLLNIWVGIQCRELYDYFKSKFNVSLNHNLIYTPNWGQNTMTSIIESYYQQYRACSVLVQMKFNK